MPREHVERYLQFERDEDATNFAFQVHPPTPRKTPKGKGKGRGGHGLGYGRGRGLGRGSGPAPHAAGLAPGTLPLTPAMGPTPATGLSAAELFPTNGHPPIPATGMPPGHHVAISVPQMYQYAPVPILAPVPAPAPVHGHSQGEYQYAPVPAPAASIDGFTAHDWKSASAYHEYHAKKLTVEVAQLRKDMHEAVRAEAESRATNIELVAKGARLQSVLGEKNALIAKLQMEVSMQNELVAASEKSRHDVQERLQVVQDHLSKTEASCLRLMNEASEKDQEITDSWASQDDSASGDQAEMQLHKLKLKRASPKKLKPKTKMKKVRASPKDAGLSGKAPRTNVDLEIQARKSFPIEYGDGGAERNSRERDISILYKKLVRERDGVGSDVDVEMDSSDVESGPKTRSLADTFAWKYATGAFISCDEFKGAREGYHFKLGPEGVGYYVETKKKKSSTKGSQASKVTTVAETDSGEDSPSSPLQSPPSSLQSYTVSMYADDFVAPGEFQQEESEAKRLQRVDNEHWDRHGRPHPKSAFQTGPSSPPASQSSSSSTSTKLRKKGTRKTVKKSKALKRKVLRTPSSSANSGCNSDDSSVISC